MLLRTFSSSDCFPTYGEYVKLAERRIRRFTYVQNVPTLFDFIVKEDKASI